MARRRKSGREEKYGDQQQPPQEERPIEILDDIEGLDSDEEPDDDPVIKTYDVFVSNQLKDHIYLLQYPIRNPDEQYYDDFAPFNARIRPKEGSMEVDVSINRPPARELDRKDSAVNSDTNAMTRQRLSGKSQLNQANYFAAVINGGTSIPFSVDVDEMHLSPVAATLQLRPNFHYYDVHSGGEKKKRGHLENGISIAKQPRAIQVPR
jgi:DNA-directed RNA polymerase III subunit RPC5